MSVALRNQRVQLFKYSSTVDGAGTATTVYNCVPSTAPDKAWWARVEEPGGREITIAEQAEHLAPSIVSFAAEAPVPDNGVLKLLSTGTVYRILADSAKRLARELQVLAIAVDDATFNLVGG